MKKLLTLGTLLLSAAAAIGCSSVDAPSTNEETDLASAADSAARPTDMGAIHLSQPRTETLSRRASAYHRYTFAAPPAGNVSGHVKLVMKSGAVRPQLRVTAPDGHVLHERRYQDPNNGAWYAEVEMDIHTGSYSIVAASTPHEAGEYTIGMEGQIACGGVAGFRCPVDLKCVGVASNVDAMGTCAPADACNVIADCAGLSHARCWGYMACEQTGKADVGRCAYHCGADPVACDQRTSDACTADGQCAWQKSGCEGNPCQTGEDGTVICHPCDPILRCVPVTP
jgi:hypothetical protein